MGSLLRILVVIPAFNEAQTIESVIRDVKSLDRNLDVVVIDDGSTDETLHIASINNVPVLRMPFNSGVGAAMRLGFRFAYLHDYDIAIQVDGDGQHLASEIPRLIEHLVGYDIVVGSRFANGAESFRVTNTRRIIMRLIAWLTSRLVGSELSDVTSGFRGANKRAIELFQKKYPPEYLGDTIESLVLAHRAGLSISEFPTKIKAREFGTSSQNAIKAFGYTMRALLVILLASIHKKNK